MYRPCLRMCLQLRCPTFGTARWQGCTVATLLVSMLPFDAGLATLCGVWPRVPLVATALASDVTSWLVSVRRFASRTSYEVSGQAAAAAALGVVESLVLTPAVVVWRYPPPAGMSTRSLLRTATQRNMMLERARRRLMAMSSADWNRFIEQRNPSTPTTVVAAAVRAHTHTHSKPQRRCYHSKTHMLAGGTDFHPFCCRCVCS